MTRVIYSLYIDIPEDELDWQKPYPGETQPKTFKTKKAMEEYYSWLKRMQSKYAKSIGVDYILFEKDESFEEYKKWFKTNYPMITSYNIVNFYKIHLMYELAKKYDEILYLDFDAVPLSTNNFFDHWNLDEGMAILTNRTHVDTTLHKIVHDAKIDPKHYHSVRSPTAKYWNARALLLHNNKSGNNDVYNTGIIGITSQHVSKLNYWDSFEDLINQMTELREEEDSMWPPHIQMLFGYDNETIWSYRMKQNDLTQQWLTEDWHHFMDKWNYIPHGTNIVHVINKNFQYVKDWYEKNNL